MKTKFFYGMTALATLGLAACTSEDLPVDNGKPGSSDGNESYYVSVAIHGNMGSGTRAGGSNGNPQENYGEDNSQTDFGNGTGNESKVKNAYFVFYNENGEVVGNIVNVDLGAPTQAPTPSGTVEDYYYKVVRVDTYKGQGKPKQVMCYINPVSSASLQNPLSQIETVTRELVVTGSMGTDDEGQPKDERYFPMSNSVYYNYTPGNPPSGDPTKPVIAVPIGDDQVFETEKAAQDAATAGQATDATPEQKAKILNIYMERYAAKLTLTIGNDAIKPYVTSSKNDAGEDVTVNFVFKVDGWALNAEAKQTYAVKNFRVQGTGGEILPDNYTWTLLNGRINANNLPWTGGAVTDPGTNVLDWGTQAWQWNNPAYHRSYWACSPAYFQKNYPEVADDLYERDADGNIVMVDGQKKLADSPQKYYSYWDIVGKPAAEGETAIPKQGFTDTDGQTAHYFRETTVGVPALASQNPAAAVASVVLAGHYEISVNGAAPITNTTFYTYLRDANNNPYVYFDNNEDADTDAGMIASNVTGTTSLYKRFLQQQTTLYKKTSNGDGTFTYSLLSIDTPADLALLVDLTKVSEISADVKDLATGDAYPMKLADRQRTLQLRGGALPATEVYVANGNGYKLLVTAKSENADEAEGQITVDEANVALMNQVGYAICYTAGAGFFNIPVKHYGWYRAGNTQKNVTEGTTTSPNTKNINWNIVRVGDFGIVRNHSYQLTINSITGLATGIGNKTTPIVPPADTKDYYMAYRVNILKWAIVPNQGVDL